MKTEQPEEVARIAKQRLDVIARINASLVGRQTLVELARQLSAQVRECFAVDACVIRLLDGEDLVLLGAAGVPEDQLAARIPIFGLGKAILDSRRPLMIQDVETDPLTRSLTLPKPGAYPFKSYAGVPLMAGDQPVGVMGIYTHTEPREFTEVDAEHLHVFASQVATALSNERLFRTVRDQQTKLVREIADRQLAEQERARLQDQLRQSQKLESIGQLAAGVAHDFNNILTVINGNASLLLEAGASTEISRELLQQIVAAGERAANLTRQLLLFSRKQHMDPQPVDLNQLTSNLTKMLGRMLGEDITLEFSYENAVPPVEADPGMLEQVIMNLAVNARDAMPRGGQLRLVTSSVEITTDHAAQHGEAAVGPHVCLAVSDTGCGIPLEIRDRIFEPFFTTKEVGKGTGLGLATAYGIVRQHHGWIELDSTVGSGTTFRIYLPATRSSLPTDAPVESLQALCGRGETVLVVEDETAVRALVVRMLTRSGYQVLPVPTGSAALALTADQLARVDLLLTDMVMPGGCSGRELARALRTKNPRLPVIYCSGYSAESAAIQKDLQDGVVFLQKPFMPYQLLSAVRSQLGSVRREISTN